MHATKRFADRVETEGELNDWILKFYEERIEFYLKFLGRTTKNNVKITHATIKTTVERYLELLKRKQLSI